MRRGLAQRQPRQSAVTCAPHANAWSLAGKEIMGCDTGSAGTQCPPYCSLNPLPAMPPITLASKPCQPPQSPHHPHLKAARPAHPFLHPPLASGRMRCVLARVMQSGVTLPPSASTVRKMAARTSASYPETHTLHGGLGRVV